MAVSTTTTGMDQLIRHMIKLRVEEIVNEEADCARDRIRARLPEVVAAISFGVRTKLDTEQHEISIRFNKEDFDRGPRR